jgi:flagellar hook-associated protein 3 FlgL
MRITGGRLIDLQAAATTSAQGQVGELAREVSSGVRVATPSQDPTAWLAAHRATLRRALSQGTGTAMAFSRDRLQQTDGALSSIEEAVSSVRALAVQGSNATYDANARQALGIQVKALFEQALASANTRSPEGEYLLAGSASTTRAFDAFGVYQGDAVARDVPTTEAGTTTVTLPGTVLTAASGVDVLPLLSQVATALQNNDPTTLSSLLGDLDTAVKQVSLARSHGGAAMSVLDDAANAHADLEQNLSADISRFVESDTVAAASNLAKASQSLDASRTVTQHILALINRVTST